MPMTFPEAAVGGLLRWAYDFSERLGEDAQIEMRMQVLRFIAQGFEPREPGFDLDAAAAGKPTPGAPARISLATLIQAFRFYDERRDIRGVTAAQQLWHLVGVQRIASLN
jgi:hypothetical protein